MLPSYMVATKWFLLWDEPEVIVAFLPYYKTRNITVSLSIEKQIAVKHFRNVKAFYIFQI